MIHHITAISSNPQKTADFYTEILGLRLVKVTINQDDVGTYHLYFGDRLGRPGTALTFFPWSDLPRGKNGCGMVSRISFSAHKDSFDFWISRLKNFKIDLKVTTKFNKNVISFSDSDGLQLEIVCSGNHGDWSFSGIPIEKSISGFYGATLKVHDINPTAHILTNYLGYSYDDSESNIQRYKSESSVIDIIECSKFERGIQGHGTVHHIAFRAKTDEEQKRMREKISQQGLHLTLPIDRYYFKSVYFREPGGVLFEIATDTPGFTVDESEETLGSRLVLPPLFETQREKIEQMLPSFKFPQSENKQD